MLQKSLTKNFPYVWEQDPALDKDAEGYSKAWAAYVANRCKATLDQVPVHPGSRPAVFMCRPLGMKSYAKMLSEISDFERCIEAIRYGLKGVDGVSLDGVPVVMGPDDVARDGGDERLKDAFLEKIFNPGLFGAMGSAIVNASQLDPTPAQA